MNHIPPTFVILERADMLRGVAGPEGQEPHTGGARHGEPRGLDPRGVGPHGDGRGVGVGQVLGLHLLLKSMQTVLKMTYFTHTVKPELAVTFIKQPTCLKQPYRMFPNFLFVLIVTSAKQPPALSSHFLCFPWVAV